MLDFPKWKVFLIVLVCLLSILYAVPSFTEKPLKFLPEKSVNLGLDLRGGSYLLLEVNFDTYLREQLEQLKSDIRYNFRGKLVNNDRIKYQGGINIVDSKVRIALIDNSIAGEVTDIIKDISRDLVVDNDNGVLSVYYSDFALREMKKNLMEQSIEIVRRRIDETGTREPDIQRQGDNRILLQVPGLTDPSQLKRLLGKVAKLTFHLVDPKVTEHATAMVPAGSMRLNFDSSERGYGSDSLILEREVMISGERLVNAQTGFRNSSPVVTIRFDSVGAKKFGEVTKNNVGRPFAIVLDNKIISAPVINEPILGGSAEISGRFTVEEANDLAILLRAGALPAPLEIVEERTVGPSLGSDSIAAGEKAVVVGTLMVMLMMLLSYGLFGIIANIALIFNITLIIAVLSVIGATLTLPGIAGIALTIGMAVDANVLIFERIREEIKVGRSPFAAIDSGFRHAFTTIFDSNLTTLIAALLLYIFGSGPVKGFAVTLTIGILASMFSAILLTRMIIVLWLKAKRPNVINI